MSPLATVRLVKALVVALLILLWPAAASAAVIYQASIFPLFTANADVGSFTNCRADQGCLGTAGNVDSNNDGAINAGDVDTLPNVLPFGFAPHCGAASCDRGACDRIGDAIDDRGKGHRPQSGRPGRRFPGHNDGRGRPREPFPEFDRQLSGG